MAEYQFPKPLDSHPAPICATPVPMNIRESKPVRAAGAPCRKVKRRLEFSSSSEISQGRPSFKTVKRKKIKLHNASLPITPPQTPVAPSPETDVTLPSPEQSKKESASQKKKRGEQYIRNKRKRYRQKKKCSARETWENLALEALKCRWRERCKEACAIEAAEVEEQKRRDEAERSHTAKLQKIKAKETSRREHEVDRTERLYTELHQEERNDTSPLLLDSVVIPVAEPSCICTDIVVAVQCKQQLENAQHERDSAFMLAREYRNIAEECQMEKRKLKYELEEKIELVRNFWRNKVVEGGSRSGKMLRAALIRNKDEL